MKKIKQIYIDFPEIKEIVITDSGDSIKCKTNEGTTIFCTTLKELRKQLNILY